MLLITVCDNKPTQLPVLSCLYIYINGVSLSAFVGYVNCHPN